MKAKRCEKIIDFTNRKRCNFNSQSARRLIGVAMSFAPMLSFIAAARFATLVVLAIFKELDIYIKAYQAVIFPPSHQHVSSVAHGTATEVLVIARKKTHNIDICVSLDAANKEGIHLMVK